MRTNAAIIVFLSLGLSAFAFGEEPGIVMDDSNPGVDVYRPGGGGKLPVVFFAHNGNCKKEDWVDYPLRLAEAGYLAASIQLVTASGCADVKDAIGEVLKKYADSVDLERIAFIGGCHGGVKMVSAMKAADAPCRVKTAVFLSISEMAKLPAGHGPILGIYSTEDRLGDNYKRFTKMYVESILTEPKKILAVSGAPHGHELVSDPSTKDEVRAAIDAWLKEKL
jgi:dienelactone hydrolase